MRISDWSSYVCSSDVGHPVESDAPAGRHRARAGRVHLRIEPPALLARLGIERSDDISLRAEIERAIHHQRSRLERALHARMTDAGAIGPGEFDMSGRAPRREGGGQYWSLYEVN